MPVAYGQYQEPHEASRGLGHHVSQPLTHALPGGSAASSPFVGHAPAAGFPVNFQPNVISPLPYNASSPFPTGFSTQIPRPAYTVSGSTYLPPNYNQRANTTGSMYQPPVGVNLTPPSTSYSTPFDQPVQQHPGSKSNTDMADDCFNIFWLFFLLGPLTWPCGFFGVCSDKQSERLAGLVSGVCLVLVVIAVIIVIMQSPADSNENP